MRFLTIVFLSLFGGVSAAFGAGDQVLSAPERIDVTGERLGAGSDVESVVPIPDEEWAFVKMRDGEKVYLVSSSGRYVVPGKVYDTLKGSYIETISDAAANQSVNAFEEIDKVLDRLAPISVGKGPVEVAVFLDPNCPYCARLVNQLDPESDVYKVHILTTPIFGERSVADVKRIECAVDRDAARDAVLRHDYRRHIAQVDQCDLGAASRRLAVFNILGVQGVPYLVRADGVISSGLPRDFLAWVRM